MHRLRADTKPRAAFTPAHSRRRSHRAFTLIELLVVIVILGVLMAVALPTYLRQQSKAKDSNAKSQLSYAYRAVRSAIPEYGDQYPSVASVVSAIQQSEPELTVTSGGCNASIDDKHVTVDSVLTSASKLALYAKSSSGTWWRMTAGTSGAQTFTALGSCNGALSSGAVTASGNEITDSTRSAASQGDGAVSPDSSFGIWQGTTNVLPNGGFETNAAGWSAGARSTAQAKFGSASLAVSFAALGDSVTSGATASLPPAVVYSISIWMLQNSGSTRQACVGIVSTGNTSGFMSSPITVPSGVWTRLSVVGGIPNDALTYAKLKVKACSALSGPETWYLDGGQIEQTTYPTPYVDTNGAAAGRLNAGVTAPSSLLTAAQGWVAMRVRAGVSNNVSGSIFSWFADTNNYLDFYWGSSGGVSWRARRSAAGVGGGGVTIASGTISPGDLITAIFAWTPTQVRMSINGSAFVSVADTNTAPAGLPATFNIGYNQQTGYLNGDAFWFACGKGTLTDADAQTIYGWGAADPTSQDFPPAAQATMAWSADTNAYVTGN